MSVRIPGKAVATSDGDGDDLEKPTQDLLRSLNLLPEDGALSRSGGVGAAFTGPPDSVAVIEAGATSASKWWATGIAAGATAVTGAITGVWNGIGEGGAWNQPFALLATGLVLAAAAGGIAYLLGSDVRGRAAAMVATIEARRDVAIAIVEQAGDAYRSPAPAVAGTAPGAAVALGGLAVSNGTKHGTHERGWKAIATRENDGVTQFLLVKGTQCEWVDAPDVDFG